MERLIKRINGQNVTPKQDKKSKPDKGEAAADSLTTELDRMLAKDGQKNWKQITGFHPSSITNNCRRFWYILFEGGEEQKDISPRLQRIFDNGHDVHSRYRGYFDAMGILIDDEVEVRVTDPVPIKGYADGILDWGGRKLYELKSISPTRFEYRKFYRKPDEKTLRQTQLYLWALNIDEALVVYECKGTQNVLIFHVPADEAAIEKELRRLKSIYKIAQSGERPARPYKRDSQQCGECRVRDWCWDKLPD